jgi:hypothetical protein
MRKRSRQFFACRKASLVPLAFIPDPCPYRELALRALAKIGLRLADFWFLAKLAGMRAIVRAGLAAHRCHKD